jgi:hypothetical protein
MVSDNFKVPQLSDNPHLELPFELVRGCFRCRESTSIWARHFSFLIRFLSNTIHHVPSWTRGNAIKRKVAGSTRNRRQCTHCAVGLVAMMSKKR